MAAERPTSTPAEVAPTEDGSTDGAAVTSDPALAAPDSSATTSAATGEVVAEPLVEEPTAAEPVVTAPPAPPAQQVVYVEAPRPFVKKGNRGFGILIAILSAIIFTALYAVANVILQLVDGLPADFSFLSTLGFYAPTIMFAIGFILLVLIVNRAGWAAHVFGSLLVGLFVFFGGTGLYMLIHISQIPSNQVGPTFEHTLFSPELIIAGLLAREVSLWMGAAIASRGRRVKARNVDAKVLYDQEIAAKRAEYERANAAAGVSSTAPVEAPVETVAPVESEAPAETVAP